MFFADKFPGFVRIAGVCRVVCRILKCSTTADQLDRHSTVPASLSEVENDTYPMFVLASHDRQPYGEFPAVTTGH